MGALEFPNKPGFDEKTVKAIYLAPRTVSCLDDDPKNSTDMKIGPKLAKIANTSIRKKPSLRKPKFVGFFKKNHTKNKTGG